MHGSKNDIEKILLDFESSLNKNLLEFESFHPIFNDALRKMLKAGGKRFRPLLLLSVVKSESNLLFENALFSALAIEFIHTYSLIHDDLPSMDDSALRRGHPTLHTVYDEATAILAGDALNTYAFSLISKSPLPSEIIVKLVQTLSDAGTYMVLGQAIDCFFENKKLDLDELIFLHKNKTGRLISAALKMGGIIVSLDDIYIEKLEVFGEKLGLLFQIQDDIIDLTKSQEETGKPKNQDINKNSFINLLGLEGTIEKKEILLKEVFLCTNEFSPKLSKKFQYIINSYLR